MLVISVNSVRSLLVRVTTKSATKVEVDLNISGKREANVSNHDSMSENSRTYFVICYWRY